MRNKGTKITVLWLVILSMCYVMNPIYASDDDTNNLGLDTEILNNKTEDYNSTTSVSDDINLFTEDYNVQLSKEKENDIRRDEKIHTSLFTGIYDLKSVDENINLFHEAVEFDKLNFIEQETQSNSYFIIAVFAAISVIAFVFTRRRFKRKAG